MAIPIDPATTRSVEFGEREVVLAMGHREAIEHGRSVCTAVAFGIPVEFSPSELLNGRVDADRDPLYVLGACNPRMADRALGVTMRIGGLFPCTAVVREEAPMRQRVYHRSIIEAARWLRLALDDVWDAIVEDTGELVEEVFVRLDATEVGEPEAGNERD